MPSQAASRRSSSHQTTTGTQHARDDSTAGTTSMLDDPKYAIASNFLATMLHEVVIDTALLIHAQIKRQRRTEGKTPGGCPVCKTSCQKSAESANGEKAIKTEAAEDGEASPVLTQETSNTPKGLEMYQNNPLLACLVCSRQVSANRYAQHLASCVGVGKGGNARRKGKNGSNVSSAKDRIKIKTALENRKKANFQTQSNRNTPTPSTRTEQEGMSGTSDDESSTKKRTLADSLGLNGNGKRTLSPSRDNVKRAKHGSGTPPRNDSRNSTQTFAPSALGSSLPVTGSPLNPHRNNKSVAVVEDNEEEEEEEEEEEGEEEEEDNDEEDEEEEEEEEEEEADEEDEEEDDDDDDEDDDEDDTSLALAHGTSTLNRNDSIADSFDDDSDDARSEAVSDTASFVASKAKPSKTSKAAGTIERSKGSDGEFIDVESASEVDDDF